MSSTLEQLNFDALYTLLKGDPGTWKSSSAITYPTPQYWFSFDRKMQALALPAKKHGVDLSKISYDDFSTWTMHRDGNKPSALSILESLRTNCPYRTIIIDSVTTAADAMLRQILDAKIGTQRNSGAAAGKFIGGIDVSEIEDFNGEAAGINELLALSKDVCERRKVNFILIAHVVRTEQKDLTGKTSIARSLVTAAKKPAAKIPAVCHETYQFSLKGGQGVIVNQEAVGLQVHTVNNSEDYARTVLPLDKILELGPDINFYKTYIEPAIEKMKQK